MPKATTKRTKTKMVKPRAPEEPAADPVNAVTTATAVAEPPSDELQPLTISVEMVEEV